MSADTFLALFQPRSFFEGFSPSWRGMTSYSASCFGGNVCGLFAQIWMRLCVHSRLLRKFTDFSHVVYSFCVHIRILRRLYGFCVHIRLLCTLCGFGIHDVQCGQSRGIQYWGFCQFHLSAQAARDSPSEFLGDFVAGLDRSILTGGLLLLWTMLICGSYINVGYKGYFCCNYDILD